MSSILYLTLRVVHVLFAATWLGATVFMSFLLVPVTNAAGPAGGQVMMGLNRKGLTAFFAALGGITVLTGLYLFWHFTSGFDPALSRSRGGMAFGIGGAAGIIALIIGGSVVGRSAKKVMDLMERAMKLPDGSEKGALLAQAGTVRKRMESAAKIVLVLQVVAIVLMALGHYI